MRLAVAISVIGHIGVLMWGYVSFPDASPFEVATVEAVPVDLVPVAELTKLREGSPTAKKLDEPSVTDPVKKLIETPNPPEPKQAEPKPPEPEKPLPKVAALPEPEPEPAPPLVKPEPMPKPPEPEVESPQPPEPRQAVPIPRPRPAPKRPEKKIARSPAPKERKFESDKIAALLDKQTPASAPDVTRKSASLGTKSGRPVSEMSQSELDALRAQIQRCWNPPLGAIEAESLKVRLKLELKPDGRLAGRPEVINEGTSPFFRAAADSARRAVQRCQPYSLPSDKYETWRDVIVTFDPREMLGG